MHRMRVLNANNAIIQIHFVNTKSQRCEPFTYILFYMRNNAMKNEKTKTIFLQLNKYNNNNNNDNNCQQWRRVCVSE